MEPPQITPEFAELFGAAKADFFVDDEHSGNRVLRQTGGAYLVEALAEPALAWPTEIVADEPLIETFVVAADGGCAGTGSHEALIDAWRPAAAQMAETVLAATSALAIPMTEPAYLTATVTPVDQIAGLAHFDDDLFTPTDGVGFVAIAGTVAGPRVACEPILQSEPPAGAQLVLSETEIERFATGGVVSHVGAPERIVAFPQFGQLHAGPSVTAEHRGQMRCLLVFRAATAPRSVS